MVFLPSFIRNRKALFRMKRINSLVVLLYFPFWGIYQSSEAQVVLSYQSFLNHVLENNPIAKRALSFQRLGEYQVQSARGAYDPFFEGKHENKFFNGMNYYSVTNTEIKQALFTSNYLKAGYDYGIGNYVNPELQTSSFGIPYIGMEVSLLQGMMIDKRRADVLKSRNYLNYYSAEKDHQLNQLLLETSLSFFDWMFSLKQVSLTNYFLQLAQQRYRGIESMAALGERPSVDTIEASLFLQSRQLELQSAEIEYLKNQNQIASFNWQANGSASQSIRFIPMDSLETYFEKAKSILGTRLYQDSIRNPLISKYTAFQHVLDIDKRLKKEMIKPKLNMNYNLLSNNSAAYSPFFSSNSYKWGIQVSFPLFLRTPINEYRIAGIASSNNQFELQNKNNELQFKLTMLSQTIDVLAAQLINAEKTVLYSRKLVEAEKQKFELGESSLFLINTREAKWLESELKLAEYKLKFIKSIVQIIYYKGNLNYEF